jgi:hypothetical protein
MFQNGGWVGSGESLAIPHAQITLLYQNVVVFAGFVQFEYGLIIPDFTHRKDSFPTSFYW